jgi:hypothetical protein
MTFCKCQKIGIEIPIAEFYDDISFDDPETSPA